MEKSYIDIESGFKHISHVSDEALLEIDNFRKGLVVPFKTHLPKLNHHLGGGIFSGDQVVIAGRSSVGKSALALEIVEAIASEHPELVFLYWSFEMKSWRNVVRLVSRETSLTVKELLSNSLSDANFIKSQEAIERFKELPIYFRDIPLTALDWEKANIKIQSIIGPGKRIVNLVDHTRLVMTGAEKAEQELISNLMLAGIRLKNYIGSTNIFLSQLNRKIEEVDRKDVGTTGLLPSYIFGADSVFQCADIVLGMHRPEMYGLKQYNKLDTKDLLIIQIMKQRDGEVCELAFKHQLKFNKILEHE